MRDRRRANSTLTRGGHYFKAKNSPTMFLDTRVTSTTLKLVSLTSRDQFLVVLYIKNLGVIERNTGYYFLLSTFFDDDDRLINYLPRSERKQVGMMDSWHIMSVEQ
ncbi:hypothetical protein Syun_006715 [Stephania yunnanensis]|uniref:Uncharacterized protein n=1 Tax=Stephania yunnanensis TaxID=152371 RepID=A0AAP0PZK3_9MAGN